MTEQHQSPGIVRWAGYLAITFLLVLPLAVLTVRSGAWQQGLMMYALACLGSVLILILSGVLLLLPKFAPHRAGLGLRALIALPGALLLLSLLGGRDYPPIHDISTNTDDPPLFITAENVRGEGANPLDIKPDFITQQLEAYPDLQTLQSTLTIDKAYDQALATVNTMGWEVYHEDKNAGFIEAVATTGIMAFKDDIVIRVRSNAAGALIDVRSVSRVGVGDIGANALRIRAFAEAFAN
ncbi:MAG: hypothetical protein ACI9JM_000173 [Halioglobus sp.]|jgi:uncharacterized protein (DUF1499 family)